MARLRNDSAETTGTASRSHASPGMIVPDEDAPVPPATAVARRRGSPVAEALSPAREAAGRDSAGRARGSTKRRRPEVTPRPVLANPHLEQGLLIAALAGAVYVLVTLATWSPADPSFTVSAPGSPSNLGGPLGAYVADLLYQGVGWAAWSVIGVAAWLVMRLAGRLVGSWWNFALGGFAIWMCATGLDLGLGHDASRAFPPGGLVGILTADLLRSNVGPAGAALAVVTGLLFAITLLFGINWQPLAAASVERVAEGVPRAGRLLGAAAGAAGRGALSAGARAGAALRSRVSSDADEAYEDDDQDAGEVGEELHPAASSSAPEPILAAPVVTVAAPAPESRASSGTTRAVARRQAVEVVPPVEDLPSLHASVWSAAAPPPSRAALDAPPPDRPTQVSGATLVEAAWEDDRASSPYDVPAPRGLPARSAIAPSAARPARAEAPPVAGHPGRVECFDGSDDFDGVDDLEEVDDLDAIGDLARDARPGEGLPPPVDDAPSNAFGVADPADAPAPPARAVLVPPALPPMAAPLARRGRKAAAEVVPGELSSGGVRDDGGAVRETSSPFQLPTLSLLDEPPPTIGTVDESKLHELSNRIVLKLRDHRIDGKVTAIRPGPVITMFEYEPAPGIKLSSIQSLQDDIAMALRAQSVRILAPIPGRGVVGFEVPNETRHIVWARDVFASSEFRDTRLTLPIMLGKDTEGRPYVADLARAPHLMVGGTTGSGKSVGINSMLLSLLMTRAPDELRLILIDPKKLEFELYKDIPHLLHPVVTEPSLAAKVLDWACEEMDRRYRMLSDWKVRNIDSFNQKVEDEGRDWTPQKAKQYFPDWPAGELMPVPRKLPFIVVVIDELADLMMTASKEVETSIARLAQKARASGIHLIVATQSPRKDVLTGLIKANLPTRLAYAVPRGLESKIILDMLGAETLLGKGDQLFVPPGSGAAIRIHGAFVSDNEVGRVADFCRAQGKPNYAPSIRLDDLDEVMEDMDELDEEMGRYYDEILELALEKGQVSTSMIQRHLKLGYNRACVLMEHLEKNGIVGPADGAKPRKVIQHA